MNKALLLRDEYGGTVTVISMGPEEALEALKHAVAMGADEAIRIWDDACAGSDTLATSYVLAKAIEKMGDVDLVLCGKSPMQLCRRPRTLMCSSERTGSHLGMVRSAERG